MISNFLFHRVSTERDQLWDPMDVALFDRCINYIKNHFEVVLLEEMLASDPSSLKNRKLATICFDDGYKDNIEFAAPVLDKHQCKASFYVVTDCIEYNVPTWTHFLEYSFQFTRISAIDLDTDLLPEDLRIKALNDKKERIEYVRKLKPILRTLKHEDRNKVLDIIRSTYSDIDLPVLMMNWRDLNELSKAGHYIGSHTVSHCMLGTMSNEEEVRQELLQSGKHIEQHLGYFPDTISYPVGSYNETTIQISKECGYKYGLAVKQRPYDPDKDSIYEIPRIELYNESWLKTRLRITNFIETFKKIIRY